MKKILLSSLVGILFFNNISIAQENFINNSKKVSYQYLNSENYFSQNSENNLKNEKENFIIFSDNLEKPSDITYANTVEMADKNQIKKWLDNKIIPVDYSGSRIGHGLHIATWIGDLELMQLFLDYGANINQVNRNGETPLAIAAFRGNKQALEFLINKGAKVNLKQELQWSPLHYAAFNGHIDLATDLIKKYNANINSRSPNGSTPLMFAIYENKNEMAKKLLELGANKNYANDKGDTAFTWAMRRNNTQLAKDLTTDEKFKIAMSKPKSYWKPLSGSLLPSLELEKLLTLKNSLLAKNKNADVSKITAQIDKEKHRLIDELFNKNSTPKVPTLQIISSRKTPEKQNMFLVD